MTEHVDLSDVCIDMLPYEPPIPPEMVAFLVTVISSEWRPGQFLGVRFLEGNREQKENVTKWAGEWGKHANLMFGFDSQDEKAQIRVAFRPMGNWSYIGTDARRPDRAGLSTLNLQNVSKGTTLHEFGHAIGCAHEHSSPVGGIKWNKPVVYRELGGRPNKWSKDKVDYNVFKRYSERLTQYTEFDPESIMAYPIPARWTTDGFSVERGSELSETDKKFIGAVYPGITINFSDPEIRTAHCSVVTGNASFNQREGNSWQLYPTSGFIEISFNQSKTYGGKRVYDRANLRMTHATASAGDMLSPIDITINGQKFKDNYSPPSVNWIHDDFDITDLMNDGDNTIKLRSQSAARALYWIHSLKIVCSGGERLRE